ncbi:FtsK-like DNA translocase [Streptomyces phage Keanu]|nr:FtsK-like DNA translocase [Streptomyces phage Keanu]
MGKVIDWDAGHGPVTGTLNAAYSALGVAAVGHEAGLPPLWALGASSVGALGATIAGASAEEPLSKGAIAARAGGWLAGGGWVTYALTVDTIWSWSVVGPLAACTCGFASLAGAIGRKRRRKLEQEARAFAALTRTRIGMEWIERFERVCNVKGCSIEGVEQWVDDEGKETGAGYDLDVLMPEGGQNWRTLAGHTEQLAADADLPEGCGVEVFAGASRRRALVKVQLRNDMLNEDQEVPLDASELDFNGFFDIGKLRDGGVAKICIRQFSAMLVGAKRTGKTNQLLAIITRLLRMPNLRVWVIDFNGGGVALQWLKAWDALGRPGRPPIDWVAADVDEAARMANAAVRVAKARKIEYQDLMAEADTDLLPLTADIPGILIITDEGAEVYANPKHRNAADPMKEVLRIAGASGVNQLNCFLRGTADTTGDTIIKSQSTVRIGMRMSDEQEMSYLLGWRSGVTPQDMPEQGFGALSMDEGKPASIFRGWRVKPSHIKWFVENTVRYRENDAFDPVSLDAMGEVYATRWERAEFIFNKAVPAPKVQTTMVMERDEDEADEGWSSGIDPDTAKANLRKAIEDAGGPSGNDLDEFQNLVHSGGLEDLEGYSFENPPPEDTAPPASPDPNDPKSDEVETNDMRDIVVGMVKAMGPEGVTVADIHKALQRQFGDDAPVRETIFRWLKKDDRIERVGHGRYAWKESD